MLKKSDFYSKYQRNLCDFLKNLNPNSYNLPLLNAINYKFAQIVTFKKIKVKLSSSEKSKLVNYYGFSVVPSGFGKDKPINDLDDYVFNWFKDEFDQRNKELYENRMKEIVKLALQNFPDSEKERKSFINSEKKKIRNMKFEVQHATSAGIYDDALTVSKSNFGCLCLRITEFGDYISNKTTEKVTLLSVLKDIYDGKLLPKSIKTQEYIEKVTNTPFNCLLYTDSSPLNRGRGKDNLEMLLSSGLARRTFFAFQNLKEIKPTNPNGLDEKITETIEKGRNNGIHLQRLYSKLEIGAEFLVSDGAREIFYNYKNEMENEYNYFHTTGEQNEILVEMFLASRKYSIRKLKIQHP